MTNSPVAPSDKGVGVMNTEQSGQCSFVEEKRLMAELRKCYCCAFSDEERYQCFWYAARESRRRIRACMS